MSDGTLIEWARHPVTGRGATWNPLLARRRDTGKVGYHCEHVSPACEHCYAETFNQRQLPARGTGLPYKPGHRADVEIFLDHETLLKPLRWKEPRGIFALSMTDMFGDFVPLHLIDRMFAVMAMTPQHVYFVLSKRAYRMQSYSNLGGTATLGDERVHRAMVDLGYTGPRLPWPLPNVWMGTTAEDQRRAVDRLHHLRHVRAVRKFISFEPLLGPIKANLEGIHWAIVGGESGRAARWTDPAWVRPILAASQASATAFFFKQWGAWAPGTWIDEGDGARFTPMDPAIVVPDMRNTAAWAHRVAWFSDEAPGGPGAILLDKKKTGRLLDGVTHDAMPDLFTGTLNRMWEVEQMAAYEHARIEAHRRSIQ